MRSYKSRLITGLATFLIGVILVFAMNLFALEDRLLDRLMPMPSAPIACSDQLVSSEKEEAKSVYRAVIALHSYQGILKVTPIIKEQLECSKDALWRGDDDLWALIHSGSGNWQSAPPLEIRNRVPELELVGEYLAKNQVCSGADQVGLEDEYKFISTQEFANLFRPNADGWASFYSQHKSSDLITLSKVGFNSNKTKALVYAASQCGWKCGKGDYFLLNKQNGAWEIVTMINSWVS